MKFERKKSIEQKITEMPVRRKITSSKRRRSKKLIVEEKKNIFQRVMGWLNF